VKIINEGSVRVDLLGGTLDLFPINLVLDKVHTLNLATSLTARVEIEEIEDKNVIFVSEDYDSTITISIDDLQLISQLKSKLGPFEFVSRIVKYFNPNVGLRIKLSSGAPPGSGLGGSSAMGAVLFSGLANFFNRSIGPLEIVKIVQGIESKILNAGPAGYQDYFPSQFGGILSLTPDYSGVNVEQLYNKDFASFLEGNVRLIFSGESRNSGINNWEVYKGFFDGNQEIRSGLLEIADISLQAYNEIKKMNFDVFLSLIGKEGELRESLFPSILTEKMLLFKRELFKLNSNAGMKVCGAGGGGCFIITNSNSDDISSLLDEYKMKELPFKISSPKETK